jgi:shikimate dehydrogenase
MSETNGERMSNVIHCAVLGSPIEHSLSPVLHTAAYRSLGLRFWQYDRYRVDRENLGSFLSKLDDSWAGLSLTMPLKQEVLAYGKVEDYWSRTLSVANTAIVSRSEVDSLPVLSLYNTDVEGIVCALAAACCSDVHSFDSSNIVTKLGASDYSGRPVEIGVSLDSPALVIGTGSTAISAVAALYAVGVRNIIIVARHSEHAESVRNVADMLGFQSVRIVDMSVGTGLLSRSPLVVSTIPAGAADGMAEVLEDLPANKPSIDTLPILLDVVYGVGRSRLCTAWTRVLGGVALQGDRMLLYQAQRQVSLMTSVSIDKVPVGAMDAAMKEMLS